MAKKVSFATKPAPKTTDEWVENRTEETIKRFTIDIPESLHRRMKTQCAARGLKMNAVIREILERNFPLDASARRRELTRTSWVFHAASRVLEEKE